MGRVLLVEDNALVQDLFCRILTREGFEVEVATRADEALQLHREAEERFDLLVTDQVLAGPMCGHELAWQLTAQDPHLRVLLVSGYLSPGDGIESAIWSPRVAFLEKPVSPRELLAAIRQLLL